MSSSHTQKKVYVGLSGGVDSSVAAALLQEQEYDVTGVFIKIWHPTISNCDWKTEMRDAMRVCAHLDIPFKMIDLSDLYFDRVIGYMLDEYKAGRTPNPDVMCNDVIKFGAFYNWAMQNGADHVATGHYAQISMLEKEGIIMKQGVDDGKDQTYFLWKIQKEQLAHILFPVGSYTKKDIRLLAEKYALPTAAKRDSQGLCFVGDLNVKEFLQNHLTANSGDVLNENGNVIGAHNGAILYTLGERHGFVLQNEISKNKPHFVIAKDITNNTITVSDKQKKVAEHSNQIALTQPNIFVPIEKDETYYAMCRYHAVLMPCHISHKNGDQMLHITFTTSTSAVAPGQSVVLYRQDGVCVAGGVAS